MILVMEISKALKEDIMNIQQQLKNAIQNHQIMVLKQREDPSNMDIKKDILEVQKHIMFLGEKQKHLVQRLRKELDEACITNGAAVTLSLGFMGKTTLNNNNNSNYNNFTNGTNICMDRNTLCPERVEITNHKTSLSRPASVNSSTSSDDSQGLQETIPDSRMADKVEFLSAVGLVTREALSELQNRRVERKRRSTANHSQFIYGSSWDVSKRKKSSYLVNQHTTRQTTRNQKPEPPDPPKLISVSSQNIEVSVPPAPQSSTSRTLVPIDGSTPGALRIAGLPESLTVERISSPQQLCVICRRIGDLSVCNNCSVTYHSACSEDSRSCPQCTAKPRTSPNNDRNSPSSCRAILQTYIGSHKVNIEERIAEKLRLQQLNTQLTMEKDIMEQRAAELTVSLAVSGGASPCQALRVCL
ncbi:PHD finger protein 21A isoform X2 [Anabrus simplex]|uniref:PHD finger protein 21A isoform X2 n=1 Tax=Anabrus simplex TaxID=316456 RepID=UPI0034DD40C9